MNVIFLFFCVAPFIIWKSCLEVNVCGVASVKIHSLTVCGMMGIWLVGWVWWEWAHATAYSTSNSQQHSSSPASQQWHQQPNRRPRRRQDSYNVCKVYIFTMYTHRNRLLVSILLHRSFSFMWWMYSCVAYTIKAQGFQVMGVLFGKCRNLFLQQRKKAAKKEGNKNNNTVTVDVRLDLCRAGKSHPSNLKPYSQPPRWVAGGNKYIREPVIYYIIFVVFFHVAGRVKARLNGLCIYYVGYSALRRL